MMEMSQILNSVDYYSSLLLVFENVSHDFCSKPRFFLFNQLTILNFKRKSTTNININKEIGSKNLLLLLALSGLEY